MRGLANPRAISQSSWLWNACLHTHLKRSLAERDVSRVLAWRTDLRDFETADPRRRFSFAPYGRAGLRVDVFGTPFSSTSLESLEDALFDVEESFVMVMDDAMSARGTFETFLRGTAELDAAESSSLLVRTTVPQAKNILLAADESGAWFGDFVKLHQLYGDFRSDWHKETTRGRPQLDEGSAAGEDLCVVELFGSEELLRAHDTEREFE